jgi:hypothetical protein
VSDPDEIPVEPPLYPDEVERILASYLAGIRAEKDKG